MLRLTSLRCRAGDFELGPVDLDLGASRLWLVLGPVGSGKSTLLRVLGGAASPRSGEVGAPPGWSRAYLPQFPEAVLGGRHLAEDLLGTPRPGTAARARARRVLVRLGLDAGALRRPGTALSAGERRRAALALLFLAGADLWAVDEPDAGLDAAAMTRVRDALAEAPARVLVIATHRFEAFAALRPHAVVLSAGTILRAGPLPETLRDPEVAAALNVFNRPAPRIWSALRKYRSELPRNVWETSRADPGPIAQVQALLADSAMRA